MKHPLLRFASLAAAACVAFTSVAAETVKVGVLHSLSGTMAISETSLKDVLLFTFDEIPPLNNYIFLPFHFLVSPRFLVQ